MASLFVHRRWETYLFQFVFKPYQSSPDKPVLESSEVSPVHSGDVIGGGVDFLVIVTLNLDSS